PQIRYSRLVNRGSETDSISFEKFKFDEEREMTADNAHDANISGCIKMADHVIYNNGDVNSSLPADDVNDANGDSLYVIPHDNTTYFEITSDLPNNSAPDSTFLPSTYASSAWGTLGLRNAGDAIQVRDPSGAYWHGISYGGGEMTGGPDNMKVTTSGLGGSCGWFNSGDYLDAANWSTGSITNETPGFANNAANLAWIRSMRDAAAPECPVQLPVDLLFFKANRITESHNKVEWRTVSEKNNMGFELLRSRDGVDYEVIAFVAGGGTTTSTQHYEFEDYYPVAGLNYYKLRQIDYDGKVRNYSAVVVNNESNDLNIDFWSFDDNQINIKLSGYSNFKPLQVEFLDILGKVISTQELRPTSNVLVSRQHLSGGIYLVRLKQGNSVVAEKIKL
ncbi:MAG: T9SS type A sorting domain-containing protein, partial [Flavobacteriales bacterium]|nr:T9SS type A sorting domain-containing protein [Flavobacteriales bacterium]